jgi:HlyD family secretion protein
MNEAAASVPVETPGVPEHSLDQLDRLVRVTSTYGWVGLLTLFFVSLASVVFAIYYRVPTKVNGEGILLVDRDRLSLVRAQGTGRLASLEIRVGDHVDSGKCIGKLAQDDLNDQIRENIRRLEDLERDDAELTRFEHDEEASQSAASLRLRRAIELARDDSGDALKIATKVVKSTDLLRAERHLGDLDLLSAREKYYEIRDALNQDESKLAELELNNRKATSARRLAQLTRRQKIDELKSRIGVDREKYDRTSRIVCHVDGQVAELLTAPGEMIKEGSPIVLLHVPHPDAAEQVAYETIIFVPAGEGKKIGVYDQVEVMPATVKREEHGFIRGWVADISEMPATKMAIEAALQHPELTETFLKRYQPGVLLRLDVRLKRTDVANPAHAGISRPAPKNPFEWSSVSGGSQPLKTGTLCQAAVVVEKRPLISLIVPWVNRQIDSN